MSAIIFLYLVTAVVNIQAAQFDVQNNAGGPVWIGVKGSGDHPTPNNGGFKLAQGEQSTVDVPDDWEGRIWGRTYCDDGSQHCLTGDCGDKVECGGATGVPPATLAEFKLKGDNGLDTYDVSLVDGFNLKASVTPQGGQSDSSPNSCKTASCDTDISPQCPGDQQVKNDDGLVIGCKSACEVYQTDELCCRGQYVDNCPPSQYSEFFKNLCPGAYSYAKDDDSSTFTCKDVPTYSVQFS